MVWERTQEAIQLMVDDAPKAKWYFSDGFDAYSRLWYHYGRYEVSEGKNDTYSVEGDNAELRHYLARLARKSRCFSRCLEALQSALKLFVFSFNRRQLHKQLFPHYQAHIKDFVYPWFSHSVILRSGSIASERVMKDILDGLISAPPGALWDE